MDILQEGVMFDPGVGKAQRINNMLFVFNIFMAGFFVGMALMWVGIKKGAYDNPHPQAAEKHVEPRR
jgi:hypothetical protein